MLHTYIGRSVESLTRELHPPTEQEEQAIRIEKLIAAGDMKRLRAIVALPSDLLIHLRHPATGGMALHAAAQHDRPDCVPLILAAGGRLDAQK
jgi:hypothetical protein